MNRYICRVDIRGLEWFECIICLGWDEEDAIRDAVRELIQRRRATEEEILEVHVEEIGKQNPCSLFKKKVITKIAWVKDC